MKVIAYAILWLLTLAIPQAFAQVDVEKVTSPKGITAWLVNDDTIPIVALEASFGGGLSLEPTDKEGIAVLFAGLLDEGSGDLESQDFARKADSLGAYFGYEVNSDSFDVSARFLKKNLKESVSHLALSQAQPRFDEDALVRVKEQILSALRQNAVNPSSQAGEAWSRAALPNSRYGRPQYGTMNSVTGLTRQDLLDIQPVMLNRNTLHIAVVGDINADELGSVLDEIFADLPNTPQQDLPIVSVDNSATGIITTEMNVPQSVVQFGHTGLLRDHPDFIPLSIVNYVLGGGGFSSRLTEEVREKNGLVYSIGSYLYPYQRLGLILGSLATSTENTDRAIDLVKKEWAEMAENGMTEAELQNAKTYITGAFPLRFDSNAKIAQYLLSAQKYDLGIDYINRYPDLINAVTLEQVNAVAKKHLLPENLLFSIAGKNQK